jgi:hypothetical protein
MSRLKQGILPEINNILFLHAEWLLNNGYYKEYVDCKKKAQEYNQKTDERQTMNRRKHERHAV